MADDPREDPEVVVKTFLQHKSLEQTQDYLARGRRFTTFDVRQLTNDWITAVRSWLAHKDHTKEQMMDDLAAELRLRGLEPPYLAVEQELADCSAQTKETERKKVLNAFEKLASSCERIKGPSIRACTHKRDVSSPTCASWGCTT